MRNGRPWYGGDGQPGRDAADVLDDFIRDLGMPRSLQDVRIGPEHFDQIAEQAMQHAVGAAQSAPDRRAGAAAEILLLAA